MEISLDGRVGVVTGGSRGIGKAIALKLAECGADVAVNFRSEAAGAAEVVAAIEGMGRRAKAYRASVTDRSAMAAMVEDVVATFGGLDLLVHNAGVGGFAQPVADSDPDEVEEMVRVHALAPHFICKLALPHMRRRGRSDIVFISSVATQNFSVGAAAYNMGKAAGEALAMTLAREERENGVRAHIVAPGLTDTDMGHDLISSRGGTFEKAAANAPWGRAVRTEEVANVVAFLASEANGYVTGQRIYVDGAPKRTSAR